MPDPAELGPNLSEGSMDPSIQAAQEQLEAQAAIDQELKVRVSIGAIGMESAEVVEVPITPAGESTEHTGKDLVPRTDQPPHAWSRDLVPGTDRSPHSWSKDLVPTYRGIVEPQTGPLSLTDRLKAGLVRRANQNPLSPHSEVAPDISVRVIPQVEASRPSVINETPETTGNKSYEETMKRQESDRAKWQAEYDKQVKDARDKRLQEARARADAAHRQETAGLRAEQELEKRNTGESVLKSELIARRSELAWASAEGGKLHPSKKSQERLEKASNAYADQLAKSARFYSEAWEGDGLGKQEATKKLAEIFADENLAFDKVQMNAMSTLGKSFRIRQSIAERRPMTHNKFKESVLSETALKARKAQLVPYYEQLISHVSTQPRQPGDTIDIAPVLAESFINTVMNEIKSRTLVKEPKEKSARLRGKR